MPKKTQKANIKNYRIRSFLLFFFLFICMAVFGEELTLRSDFELLCGKRSGWQYADQPKDLSEIAFYKAVYEKHRDLQFLPENSYPKIPKVLHFIWLGPKNFPLASVENVRSWISHHPGWTCKFWTDRPRIPPVSTMEVCEVDTFSFQYLKDLFHASSNWGEKSDLLRYEILFQEGGVYVDHDMVCYRSYDQIVSHYDFFAGLSTSHPRVDGFSFTAINCHFGARAGHPVLRTALEKMEGLQEKAKRSFPTNIEKQIMHTSYVAFTHAVLHSLNQEENVDIVFPNSYFLSVENGQNFYAKHLYAGDWKEGASDETPRQSRLIDACWKLSASLERHFWMQASVFLLVIGAWAFRKSRKKA